MFNFITKLLKLNDPNIEFSENVAQIIKKNITYNLIHSPVTEIQPFFGLINKSSFAKNVLIPF